MSSQVKTTIRAVLSLLFAVTIGIGGWFAAPSVDAWMSGNVSAFAQLGLSDMVIQIIITVFIFFIGMAIVVLLLSALLPGDKQTVTEKSLAAEHNARFANRDNRHRKRRKR